MTKPETSTSTKHLGAGRTLGVKSATPWAMRVRRPVIWTHAAIVAHDLPVKTVVIGSNDDNGDGGQTPSSTIFNQNQLAA